MTASIAFFPETFPPHVRLQLLIPHSQAPPAPSRLCRERGGGRRWCNLGIASCTQMGEDGDGVWWWLGRSWLSWDRGGQRCLCSSNAGFGTAASSVGMCLFKIQGFYLQVEGWGLLGPHPALAMRVLHAGGWEPGVVLSSS